MAERTGGEQFVYLYRDPDSYEVRYIGRGKELTRPLKHLTGSHNTKVNAYLAGLNRRKVAPIVEWVGPFNDERTAKSVEAALISSYWNTGILNQRFEDRQLGFRSFALPATFATRQYEPRVTRADIRALGGALAVYVSAQSFADNRPGSLPRLTLEDAEVSERIRKWWQVGRHVRSWHHAEHGPKLLIGLTGPPSRRWVFGALLIDHTRWGEMAETVRTHQLWEVPAVSTRVDLDADRLRGRLVRPGDFGPVIRTPGHRQFGGIRAHFVDVV